MSLKSKVEIPVGVNRLKVATTPENSYPPEAMDPREKIQSLRREANMLENALRLSGDEFEYIGHATVTVKIDVVGSVWADSEDSAEETFVEALQEYYYGINIPEPFNHRDDVVGVEFESEQVDEVELLWLDKQEDEEEWDDD